MQPRSPFVFVALSLGLHAAAVVAVLRAGGQTFHPTAEGLEGETMDLEAADQATEDPAAAEAEQEPDQEPTSTSTPTPTATATSTPTTTPSSPPPLPFGAAGVRYAADLATTFTRSFPQAASSDPIWHAAPFGPAGSAVVSLVIDETGRLASAAVLGDPPTALRRGIERTLTVLEPRSFTASAAITRLKVTARVTRDDVHDGLHGEVFALSGGSFVRDVGSAFFALPQGGAGAGSAASPGRRVDIEVRLLP